jgi:AcrR family transcriptional regulator
MTPTAVRVRRAALELFAERGFHGTGIRQLAERAGVSSASLYHYMGTKEELLVALMTHSLERLVDDAQAAVASSGDPVEQLEALVRMHVTAHASRPLDTRVGDHEVEALSEPARAQVVTLRDRYEQVWQEVLAAGLEAGVLRAEHPAVARRALLEMCSGVARWFDPAGPLTLEDLADHYVALAARLLGVSRPTRRGGADISA